MRKILLVFLLLTGCASYRPNAQATKLDIIEKAPAYSLGIVEFDDQGWFFDRADVERVLSMVEEEVKGNGATVVVFAHGWHHNAAANDGNLTKFKAALASIDELLHKPLYKSIRDIVIKGAKNRVVGVYVGEAHRCRAFSTTGRSGIGVPPRSASATATSSSCSPAWRRSRPDTMTRRGKNLRLSSRWGRASADKSSSQPSPTC